MTPDQRIFQQGSKTYYNSTRFFPRRLREDVTKLYSFVRVADNYVDAAPQQIDEFYDLVKTWRYYANKDIAYLAPSNADSLNARVTKNICRLRLQYHFERAWIEAFLSSMRMDTKPVHYRTLDNTLRYTYGSAEVIGLMMARLMDLPEEASAAAAMQGRAMQYINFLRDIAEDANLGRNYFPEEDLKEYGLPDLKEPTVRKIPEEFREFARFEIIRYHEWQRQADNGMHYIPKRYRLPIQAAARSYEWTARQIARDPFVVYRQKVKPSKIRIVSLALTRVFG